VKYVHSCGMTENGKKIQQHLEKLQGEMSLGLEIPLKFGIAKNQPSD
jgi:hypothetical protein